MNFKQPLADAVIAAHEKVLGEFSGGGAAQLLHEEEWSYLDKEALARTMETVSIVAVLIATMGFTGFLSPPGSWIVPASANDTSMAAAIALTPHSSLRSVFGMFAICNTLALALSMSLVLFIAVGSAFGHKAQGMRIFVSTGFSMLVLAVVAAFMAYGAAAFIISPDAKLRGPVIGILIVVPIVSIAVIALVVAGVRRKARLDAYKQRLATLHGAASQALNMVRTLNSCYFRSSLAEEYCVDFVGDASEARYFLQYSIIMGATLIPLFHHFLATLRQHNLCSTLEEDINAVANLLHKIGRRDGLHDYWQRWCDLSNELEAPALAQHFAVCDPWDVGVSGVRYRASDGIAYPHITESAQPDVAHLFEELDRTARPLVMCLLEPAPSSRGLSDFVAAYRRQVKLIFTIAKLTPMMPPSIRDATLREIEITI
jgi:hypothetical protein